MEEKKEIGVVEDTDTQKAPDKLTPATAAVVLVYRHKVERLKNAIAELQEALKDFDV